MFLSARFFLFIFLMVSFPFSTFALDVPKSVTVITAPEVRKMTTDGKALLVHTLSDIEYQMQHIPGSINIPVDEVESSSLMPKDKASPIIFYCNGKACPYSLRASKAAAKLGYSQVFWFQGGIMQWRKFQYDMKVNKALSSIKISKLRPENFRKKIQENALVLDVRPQWWRQSKEKAGVIVGTEMMIPLLKLKQRMDLLPKDRPILVTDRLMRQSVHAAKFLKMNGFEVIGVLKGGSKRWVSEKLPILDKKNEPPIISNSRAKRV